MSIMDLELNEPYIRFSIRLNKIISDKGTQKSGRKPPLILRPSTEFVIPEFRSAFESIAFYTLLVFRYPDNDLMLSKVVNHLINTADKYNYQGDWKLWLFAALYFNVEVTDNRSNETINEIIRSFSEHNVERNKTSSLNHNSLLKNYEAEGTIFSELYWFEFLQLCYSIDTIFGNIVSRCAKFDIILRVKDPTLPKYSKLKIQKLNTSEYKDKGSLPDPVAKYRRLCNIQDELRKPKFDTLSQVSLWGHERLSLSEGGD